MYRNAPTAASWSQVKIFLPKFLLTGRGNIKSVSRREMEALRSENLHVKQVIFKHLEAARGWTCVNYTKIYILTQISI
jgi:hypothetical protein